MKQHPQLSERGQQLLQQYVVMAEEGYDRADKQRVVNAFDDFEARAYRKLLKPVLDQFTVRTLLDYGCGGSDWEAGGFDEGSQLSASDYFGLSRVLRYEPARGLDERAPADCVLCFDVLEHIYIADIAVVLRDVFTYATRLVVLNIACYPAAARLPNGENAHVTVRGPLWWKGVVESISMEFPDVAVNLICSTGWRKSHQFPIWRPADWLLSDKFVTPPIADNLAGNFENLQAAITHLEQSLSKNPGNVDNVIRLAVAHEQSGHLKEAEIGYRQAIALDPSLQEPHSLLGSLLLLQGMYAEGWEELEWRLAGNAAHQHDPRQWQGQALEGKCLLVLTEQGIGDEIMFASCLGDVVRQAKKVIVVCAPRLAPLFERSFPELTVVPKSENQFQIGSNDFDYFARIGSLPRFLRRHPSEFPQQQYLKASDDQVSLWRDRFSQLPGELNVGISWRGGWNMSRQGLRSIPLEQFLPLFVNNVNVINLQYDRQDSDVEHFEKSTGKHLHNWDDVNPMVNIDYQAAQISALDLLIGVDNSTIHLAGSLGVPCWTILPLGYNNWRWLLNEESTLWYESMRLLRISDEATVLDVLSPRIERWLKDRT